MRAQHALGSVGQVVHRLLGRLRQVARGAEVEGSHLVAVIIIDESCFVERALFRMLRQEAREVLRQGELSHRPRLSPLPEVRFIAHPVPARLPLPITPVHEADAPRAVHIVLGKGAAAHSLEPSAQPAGVAGIHRVPLGLLDSGVFKRVALGEHFVIGVEARSRDRENPFQLSFGLSQRQSPVEESRDEVAC